MAQDYQISKNTVESAYSQLFAEGYIESRPQSRSEERRVGKEC